MFLRFPKLPPEIRLNIWAFAVTPRTVIIEVTSRCLCVEPHPQPHPYCEISIYTKTPVPTTLHANRESRAECMRSLTWIRGVCENCPDRYSRVCTCGCNSSPGIPLSLDFDTVFIPEECAEQKYGHRRPARSGHGALFLFAQTINKAIVEKIKFLAIDYSLSKGNYLSSLGYGWARNGLVGESLQEDKLDVLKEFKGLNELYLMDRYPDYRPGAVTVRIDDKMDSENLRVLCLKTWWEDWIRNNNKDILVISEVRKVPAVRVAHCTGAEAEGVIERMRRDTNKQLKLCL